MAASFLLACVRLLRLSRHAKQHTKIRLCALGPTRCIDAGRVDGLLLPALATAGSAAAATADTAGAAVAASKSFGFFAMFVPTKRPFLV